MARRKVIRIDEAKCDGCGKCVPGCKEGAIAIVDGKARLVSDVYCDGLGACLGECHQGAITIEEREAEGFDEAKVQAHLVRLRMQRSPISLLSMSAGGHQCPGSMARSLGGSRPEPVDGDRKAMGSSRSELTNWPVQLALVPPNAPYFRRADLLLVADCVPFACADFHHRFLRGRPVIIGCPKLDQADFYVRKLTEIIRVAEPQSLSVVHMEVPCCSGLTRIAQHALAAAESGTPLRDVTVGIRGNVLATG
jgi:Pyruvate/2-oxoacid:ferredoxin oxidoreductase delta subunit